MPTVQQWGRKESIIWPPRCYLYTLSALFLALAATGLFIYVHFQYGLSPLERYYLPYYLRSEMPSLTRHASTYQLLYVSDGKSQARPALEGDVERGATPQITGEPLPLALSAQARQPGENPPVGLILCAEKGAAEAHYALDNLPNKVLAAEYQTVLPDEKLIAEELERSRRELEERARFAHVSSNP